MYCPKCGTADQIANSYCRRCGEFLIDASDKFNSVFKFFGINTTEKQINLNLLFDLASVIFSLLLLIALIGYFQVNADNHPPIETPTIIYLVEAFLVFITAWQFLGFMVSINLKSKFINRTGKWERTAANPQENEMLAADTLELPPPADTKDLIAPAATENTTCELVIEPRK